MGFWNKDDLSTDTTQSSSDKDASPAGLVASTPNALASTGNSMAKPAAAESAKSGEPKDFDSMVIERFGPSLRSALGPGTVIRGKLSFDTPVRIDGKLSGEITSTSAVIVGPQGVLDAKIDVESLVLVGEVRGEIAVRAKTEIFTGGIIDGSIATGGLVIHEGGKFNGECRMQTEQAVSDKSKDSEAQDSAAKQSTKNKNKSSKKAAGAPSVESAELKSPGKASEVQPAQTH